MKHHLGVAFGPEDVTEAAQPFAHLDEIVDLAVEHRLIAAVGIGHGLVAGGGRVEDGEPGVGQADGAVVPDAFVVGAAVAQQADHGRQHRRGNAAAIQSQDSTNSAHTRFPWFAI